MKNVEQFRGWFFSVHSGDTDVRRRATSFLTICLSLLVVTALGTVVYLIAPGVVIRPQFWFKVALIVAVLYGASALARRGSIEAAGLLLASVTALLVLVSSIFSVRFDTSIMLLLVSTIASGFALSARGVAGVLLINLFVMIAPLPLETAHETWTQLDTKTLVMSAICQVALSFCAFVNTRVNRQFFEAEASARREQQRLRQQAEAASRAKSQFLANMSHELRTPLNAIIGYSEMIQEELEELDAPEEVTEDSERVMDAGRSLLAMVTDVLEMAQVEDGSGVFDVQSVSLESLLEEVAEAHRAHTAQRGNALHLEIEGDLGFVHTDPRTLLRILGVLLANANAFTDGGVITLRAGSSAEGAFVAVEDTGCGIPSELHERIFEPFEQADNSFTREHGGAGMGLALAKRLVDGLGGEIVVESTPGEGSTFRVTLPGV